MWLPMCLLLFVMFVTFTALCLMWWMASLLSSRYCEQKIQLKLQICFCKRNSICSHLAFCNSPQQNLYFTNINHQRIHASNRWMPPFLLHFENVSKTKIHLKGQQQHKMPDHMTEVHERTFENN